MYLQESLLPDWESAPKRLKGGLKTGKSKASLPKVDKEDITSIQLSLFDMGSGLNFKRKGLQTLLDRVLGNTCKLVVIAHKDRLCRFGFDLISWLCARQQTQVLVLNQANLSPEREMVEDILAIIHVFSWRLYGLRKYKKQVAEDSELPSVSSKGT